MHLKNRAKLVIFLSSLIKQNLRACGRIKACSKVVITAHKFSPLSHIMPKPKKLPKKHVHKPLNKLNNNLQIKINIKIIAIISKYEN